ncbi:hypothetical protein P3X46_028552 [Hevea brasiliensis]|uniref:Uncharacterized protein n=1 Tax=Hevea brasiliensis TaxID=3981 RepID=A0ABQ9KSD1_HEVBR|nr:hypothetical protein P3X46_028552 [Hevea brasiliensis]
MLSDHSQNSSSSIGPQNSTRHRSPFKQRKLEQESNKYIKVLTLGPDAYRDHKTVNLGFNIAVELFFFFFRWVETYFSVAHAEMTCREMACVLARGNRLKKLWKFLKKLARRENGFGIELFTNILIRLPV